MFSLRDILGTLLIIFVLMAGIFFAYDYHERHSPDVLFLKTVDDFDQGVQHSHDSAPLIHALNQTTVCVRDALPQHLQETLDHQRLAVWDPCVQQGVTRLQQGGHDSLIAVFHERLQPLKTAFDQR